MANSHPVALSQYELCALCILGRVHPPSVCFGLYIVCTLVPKIDAVTLEAQPSFDS